MNIMPYFLSYFFMRQEERFKLLRKRFFFLQVFPSPLNSNFVSLRNRQRKPPEDHNHGKIRLTECNAKCRYLKKLTCKGT
jgi:hypothetical protein